VLVLLRHSVVGAQRWAVVSCAHFLLLYYNRFWLPLNLSLLTCLLHAIGAVAVPSGMGGFLLGSYITKRLSLTNAHLLRAMFILALIGTAMTAIFTIQCDTTPLADVSQQPALHNSTLVCTISGLYLTKYKTHGILSCFR